MFISFEFCSFCHFHLCWQTQKPANQKSSIAQMLKFRTGLNNTLEIMSATDNSYWFFRKLDFLPLCYPDRCYHLVNVIKLDLIYQSKITLLYIMYVSELFTYSYHLLDIFSNGLAQRNHISGIYYNCNKKYNRQST